MIGVEVLIPFLTHPQPYILRLQLILVSFFFWYIFRRYYHNNYYNIDVSDSDDNAHEIWDEDESKILADLEEESMSENIVPKNINLSTAAILARWLISFMFVM